MKKYILIPVLFFSLISCEKREEKKVEYIATDASSAFNISYRDGSGQLQSETVEANSSEDRWHFSFTAEQGDIVYLSGIYHDINSALKMMIMVDGKLYKQGESIGDTLNYLIVSGVVPY